MSKACEGCAPPHPSAGCVRTGAYAGASAAAAAEAQAFCRTAATARGSTTPHRIRLEGGGATKSATPHWALPPGRCSQVVRKWW
jgi:hypothetical protein